MALFTGVPVRERGAGAAAARVNGSALAGSAAILAARVNQHIWFSVSLPAPVCVLVIGGGGTYRHDTHTQVPPVPLRQGGGREGGEGGAQNGAPHAPHHAPMKEENTSMKNAGSKYSFGVGQRQVIPSGVQQTIRFD